MTHHLHFTIPTKGKVGRLAEVNVSLTGDQRICLHSASEIFAFYMRTGLRALWKSFFSQLPQHYRAFISGLCLPIKKRGCLLKLSSSSMVLEPGLRYLKGAIKVDSMLTFSRRKQNKRHKFSILSMYPDLLHTFIQLKTSW